MDTVVTLCLGGDVMTGRGIDQILPCPSAPGLYESHVRDARVYVELAEQASGPIPRPVEPAYVWGDALAELDRVRPAARIVNLETAVTRSEARWTGKGIHYRMHPDNVSCLAAAALDVCALANNHVLDYGYAGLRETVETLRAAGLGTAGAGATLAEARRPATVPLPTGGRLLVFALGARSSGIPRGWAAAAERPGLDLLPDLADTTADEVVDRVRRLERPGDLVVASIHWGANWGYAPSPDQVRFAHRLVDGGVDLVHGHSSHHPRPIEVYRDRLVLYGCGDLVDDYEGIGGREEFRDELRLLYFPRLRSSTGALLGLRMAVLRVCKLTLVRASAADTAWTGGTLDAISRGLGSRVEPDPEGGLALRWDGRAEAPA
jgi:poly-gamma-glutamate synthesis protein (capsule biosynthesis protein)